jgi:tetratricopeptide (TPR) repeat protein
MSASLLTTLGIQPALGRNFLEVEDRPNGERVALLSDRLWRAHFQADPAIVGRSIRLNDELSVTIVGVLPASFQIGDESPELCLPLRLDASSVGRGQRGLEVIARLNLGVSEHQLQSRLALIAGQLREAIGAYERTLADRERVQGRDHADTRSARAHLAAAYQQAGRLGDAIYHFEQALADSEQMLGPGDLETLTARSSLAAATFAAGRRAEVIPLLQRTLADSERYLGPDHPLTAAARDNLEAASRN